MICVDILQQRKDNPKWKYGKSCHLFSDTKENSGVHDLHVFAYNIGLKDYWFHNDPKLPHYDLTEGKRDRAVKNGAKEVSDEYVVEVMKKWRKKNERI